MIRLAIHGAEEATWRTFSPRLRGATVVVAPTEDPPPSGDAVAFLGSSPPEKSVIAACLRAGKPVLLLAPPSTSEELESLLSTAQQTGVRLAVFNPKRYLPSRRLIQQQLAERIGAPGLIRVHHWQPRLNARGLWLPLVREIDLTMWLMGTLPERIFALDRLADSGPGYLQVHLGFPGGSMALLDLTDRLPAGDRYHSLSVIGFSGAAYADDHQNMQLVYRGGHPQAVRTEEEPGALAALVQDFVAGLQDGRDLTAATLAWREVYRVVAAVKRAAVSGLPVALEGR